MGVPAGPDALRPAEVVTSLSQCYSSLLDSMNAEIRIRWLQIVVRNDYYPDLHRVRRFLESQVRPLRGPRGPFGSSCRRGVAEGRAGRTWHRGACGVGEGSQGRVSGGDKQSLGV